MFYINIFTYKNDEEIIKYSALCAKKLFGPDCQVFVIDDHLNPIDTEIKEYLEKNDINYRKSYFNRNGNLNGKECCIGILSEMLKSCNGTSGVNIKLDSDTLILKNRHFIDMLHNNRLTYLGTSRIDSIFSGICYAIKTEIIEKMISLFKILPFTDEQLPEDLMIGSVATIVSFDKITKLISNYNGNSGDTCAWNFKNKNNPLIFKHYYEHFDIVTFGNWFTEPNKTLHHRNIAMKEFFNLIK